MRECLVGWGCGWNGSVGLVLGGREDCEGWRMNMRGSPEGREGSCGVYVEMKRPV